MQALVALVASVALAALVALVALAGCIPLLWVGNAEAVAAFAGGFVGAAFAEVADAWAALGVDPSRAPFAEPDRSHHRQHRWDPHQWGGDVGAGDLGGLGSSLAPGSGPTNQGQNSAREDHET